MFDPRIFYSSFFTCTSKTSHFIGNIRLLGQVSKFILDNSTTRFYSSVAVKIVKKSENNMTNAIRISHLECEINALTKNAANLSVEERNAKMAPLTEELKSLKEKEASFDRTKFEEMVKKRFFFTPSFSIYGGVAGLYDYGPPGCSLQANILQLWRNFFILEEQMLEVDCTIMTPEPVLKTSGHVDRFTDLMVLDKENGRFFRADHLVEGWLEKACEDSKCTPSDRAEYQQLMAKIDDFGKDELAALIEKYKIKAPESGNDLTEPVPFNLMFDTQIGPTGNFKGYLRPETAQGMFVNFKKLLEFNNDRMPFAAAQIGKSFRNEISPRAGLLRVREFTMAEIEHFVHPEKKTHPRFDEVSDISLNFLPSHVQEEGLSSCVSMKVGEAVSSGMVNNQTLGYFLARIFLFLTKIGIDPNRLRFRQHMKNEMAHYACDCWDAEIHSSYGWVECVGCADRSAYDLTKHTEATNEKLVAREKLDAPKQITRLKLELSKKDIGIHFKKDAKVVSAYFEALKEDELKKLQAELSAAAAGSSLDITTKEGASFKVPVAMIKVPLVTETVHVDEYIPSVIEPSFGIGRILYSLLEHSYWIRAASAAASEEEEKDKSAGDRRVLSFPALIAPVKVALLPLSTNDAFKPLIKNLRNILRYSGVSFQVDDSSSSIGRRYARNDELGIPFGITVDFDSVNDGTVTLRERDTTSQVRVNIDEVSSVIVSLCNENLTWKDVTEKYPSFLEQQSK